MFENTKTDGNIMAEFSYDLDQIVCQNRIFIFEQVLELIEKHFGYPNNCFTLYHNGTFYRTIYRGALSAGINTYMKGFNKRDAVAKYITEHCPFTDFSSAPVFRSSEVLTHTDEESVREYLDFLSLGNLHYVAVAPSREYRLCLYKSEQEGDFSDEEVALLSDIAKILNMKYRLSRMLVFERMINVIKSDVINHACVGVIIVNSRLEIIDSNEAVTRYLRSQSGQVLSSAYFSMLIEEKLSESTLSEPVRFSDDQVFVDGTVAELSMKIFTNNNLYGENYHYHHEYYYIITIQSGGKSEAESAPGFYHKYGLSKREMEIVEYLSGGAKCEDIAKTLYISTNTVRTHIKNIYSKMNINNQRALLSIYNQHK